MNFLKNLFVSAALTISRYLPNQDQGVLTDTTQGEQEPQREQDEWYDLIHHDDVTPEEEMMLMSDDPKQILQARQQIEKRQAEFQEIWDDVERRREIFQAGYLGDADVNRSQTPMHLREGWEDDDDMPETFIGVNQETGDLEEIGFDELPEWQNVQTDMENT